MYSRNTLICALYKQIACNVSRKRIQKIVKRKIVKLLYVYTFIVALICSLRVYILDV